MSFRSVNKLFRPAIFLLVILALSAWAQTPSQELDSELTSKLRTAFRQVEGLDKVSLEVRGGVAVLRGTVSSYEDKLQAQELAQKVDGILTVDNGIEVDTSVENRLGPAFSRLYVEAMGWLNPLPLFLVALTLFFLIAWIGSLIRRWDWLFTRFSDNLFIQDLMRQGASLLFTLLGALVALEILEATALVGALLGAAGVAGLAFGFAFKDMAENSLASVLLGLRQPFEPNDLVSIDGREGRVVRLTSRATILLTLDGNHLRLPNSDVFKAAILNYTRNPERRFSFKVGVGVEEPLAQAQALAVKVLTEMPSVMDKPKPQCRVEELADFSVVLGVYGWVDQTHFDFLKVQSEAIRTVKEAFDEAGVSMPYPNYVIWQQKAETEAAKPSPDLDHLVTEADVSVDRHLDELIDEERATAKPDLLDTDGTIE